MGASKQFSTTVPIEPDADIEVARWLARESIERTADNRGMKIHDYTETIVPAADIPPKMGEHLPLPIDAYVWYRFTAVGRVDDDLAAWFTAESQHRNEVNAHAKSV
ncbi:minor tail protein [Mycobacterium phage Feyre]